MSQRISVLLFQLDHLPHAELKRLSDLFESNYFKDEIGYGFYDVELHSNYLSAKMLSKTPTVISEYNSQTNEIERKTIFIYSNISFAFDSNYNLLEVYASQKESTRLRSILLTKYLMNHSVCQLCLAPFNIYPILHDISVETTITRLNISNFRIANKAYGNYNIIKANQNYVIELLSEYKEDIKKISLTLKIDGLDEFDLTISTNGQLSIKSEEPENVLTLLKSEILNN